MKRNLFKYCAQTGAIVCTPVLAGFLNRLRIESLGTRLEFYNYKLRRGDRDAFFEHCQNNPNQYHPRIAAWVSLVEKTRGLQDPFKKAVAINGWVNTAISYDYNKWGNAAYHQLSSDWFRTPLATIEAGHGICGDQALLKYETLLLVGFSQDNVMNVIVRNRDVRTKTRTAHIVAAVAVGGRPWILNNQQVSWPPGVFFSDALQHRVFTYLSELATPASFFGDPHNKIIGAVRTIEEHKISKFHYSLQHPINFHKTYQRAINGPQSDEDTTICQEIIRSAFQASNLNPLTPMNMPRRPSQKMANFLPGMQK